MPTAILSVHNKTGLVEFAQSLASLGWGVAIPFCECLGHDLRRFIAQADQGAAIDVFHRVLLCPGLILPFGIQQAERDQVPKLPVTV